MKNNKFEYLWIVQGQWPDNAGHHPWEDETAEETYKEGRARLKEYRENQPQVPHRLIYRREPNPDYTPQG